MELEIKGTFEGPDKEYFEELAADQADLGQWTVEEAMATCLYNVKTATDFNKLLNMFGDSLDEEDINDINNLAVGGEFEVEKGWGCVYSFKRLK